MLTEKQCENIIPHSLAEEAECLIQSGNQALTRFADNVIHQFDLKGHDKS